MQPQITDVTFSQPITPGLSRCESVFRIEHADSGLVAFIALHRTDHGPAVGGVRRRRYTSEAEAVADAVSLATQMTRKVRFADLPCGGGKSVIIDHDGLKPEAAYAAFGRAITALGGRYFCGPDVGTGPTEMGWIRTETSNTNSPDNDASEATARGVLAGLRAATRFAHTHLGAGDPATLHYLVQGVGGVGSRVVDGLPETARCSVADTNPATVEALVRRRPSTVVPVDQVVGTPCDVFAPCAVGPVLTSTNVSTLRAKLVCGCANTQLESDSLAEELHRTGVLYIPDFIVNSGAVIEGVTVLFDDDKPTARTRAAKKIDAIETRVTELLESAHAANRSPLSVGLARS
ncbi:MAG: glutamate dehydrogenase/leucine dehydrogenase [Myxococcota bacterium]|jgi:glutamate dehydrogenase/leucine dehydrogenase